MQIGEMGNGNGSFGKGMGHWKHYWTTINMILIFFFFPRIGFDFSCFDAIYISDSPFRGSARLGMGFA